MSTIYGNTSSTQAENREHNYNLSAKRVTQVGNDERVIIDETSQTIMYIGRADRGTNTSDNTWLIERHDKTISGINDIQHAIDSWDNRASASYA